MNGAVLRGGTLSGTSALSTSSRGRRLALGAAAVVTVGFVGAYASTTGAQSETDPVRLEIVSVDGNGAVQVAIDSGSPAISDNGGVIAYEAVVARAGTVADDDAPASSAETSGVWIRDRVGRTTRVVAENNSVAPGISGNGCLVAYSVITDEDVTLTVVDLRDLPDLQSGSSIPIGTVIETVELETAELETAELETAEPEILGQAVGPDAVRVAAPALSFDGSTIVWSTGREVRRYVRSTPSGAHVRTNTFDTAAGGSPGVVTGPSVDVSGDGRTVVFVAGPGDTPFAPTPANVYVWTAPASQLGLENDPELLSATSSGEPGASNSGSPTISADGTFAVFESAGSDLAVVGDVPATAPFVVGVDRVRRTGRIIVEDATRPTLSADGNHVVYQRGDAVRVLSSSATSSVDSLVAELAGAGPSGAAAVSQFGRWIVFASTGVAAGSTDAAPAVAAPAIWAADRRSSEAEVVDTTIPPTSSTTPTTQPTATVPSAPTSTQPEIASPPTNPATAVVFTDDVVRFPTASSPFGAVPFPSPPRQVAPPPSTRPSGPAIGDRVSALATPASFGSTVVDAGRRTQPVTLTNPTAAALQVSDVSIDVPDVFTIVSGGCVGVSIAPGASCDVQVQFAPVTVGRAVGTVVFRLADGAIVTASLDGDGVPGPTLDLVPAVAGAGQTVTVFGVGFPAGTVVDFSQPGVELVEPIVVDPDGSFAHVVVVLPNTPIGPAVLVVNGQPDAFDDVTAELLVSTRGMGSGDAAVRGGVGRLLGR